MIISPPYLPDAGRTSNDESSTDPMMDTVDAYEATSGMYPIAADRRWHPGMHLSPRMYNERVYAIADGEVIAYRVCQRAYDGGGGASDSNAGFVLLKHTTETGEGRTLTFYSLYMHLLELNGYQSLGSDGKFLPEFLRMPSPGAGAASPIVPPAQSGGGKKVRRKDVLGFTGKCQDRTHLHVEIFMTKPNFEAYFGHTQLGREQVSTPTTTDYWGNSYYVIPPGQQFYPMPPGSDAKGQLHGIAFDALHTGNNEDTLYVESYFHKGSKYTMVSRDAGQGRLEALTEAPLREADYEYNLYKRAMALYPDCPSDGYEMLRFGRILSTPTTLAPTARSTWMRVAFAKGQEGYIDVSQASILKLSDADFPFFKGWKKISEGAGLHSDDGLCDIDALKKILSDTKARETAEEKAERALYNKEDELVRYVKTHKPIRDALRGFVCEAPSEWDGSHNDAKFRKLKEPGEFYDGNEAGYAKFIKLLESFQFWDKTGLPVGEKLWFFHPMAFIRHFRRCGWINAAELARGFPPTALRTAGSQWVSERVHPSVDTIIAFGSELNKAMRKFVVLTPVRQAAFLGNAMQETQWFSVLTERNASSNRYYPWIGQGFMQLTWPDNYIKYWHFRGLRIEPALAERLRIAAVATNQTRSNAALVAAEIHVPPKVKEWRDNVGTKYLDASDSAGAYWAWSGAAMYADKPLDLRREAKHVGNTMKPYYSCVSFGQVAATVNLGRPSSSGAGGVNGIVARYQAFTSALIALADLVQFPGDVGAQKRNPKSIGHRGHDMKSTIKILAIVGLVTAEYWSAGLSNNRLLAAASSAYPAGENRAEYVVSSCHIRIANMFGGYFSVPYSNGSPSQQGLYHFPSTGPFRSSVLYGAFSLSCFDAQDVERIAIALGAKQINGKWLRYDPSGSWGAPLMQFDKQQHAKIMEFKGGNWTATGMTVDDTTGDEQARSRVFSFCLFHKSQALCGKMPVVFLANPKDDELWKVKTILQSVEFVE